MGWRGRSALGTSSRFFNHTAGAGKRQSTSPGSRNLYRPAKSERRNIRMANPAPGKRTSEHPSLLYQMVGPGQFARAHRHTVNAGRFILESDGAYTTLNGEKVFMDENDLILTPNWVWHGLGNESESHSVSWIDFLDDPLVSHLQTIFLRSGMNNHPFCRFKTTPPFTSNGRTSNASWPDNQILTPSAAIGSSCRRRLYPQCVSWLKISRRAC